MSGVQFQRGDRSVDFLDLAQAEWVFSKAMPGVKSLVLNRDEATGADSHAFHAPAGFAVDEKAHFADTDHEIFMFEGDFAFDSIHPLKEGDYLYRPAGTVYGDNEHSVDGGTQIIYFSRRPARFHFEDGPQPWPGEYLVDQVWNPRPVQPSYVRTRDLRWELSSLGRGITEKRIRGVPGEASTLYRASSHSPWASDAAFLLRIPVGHRGAFPTWPGTILELLAISGHATIGSHAWYHGCHAFGVPAGDCQVDEDLVLFARSFKA